MLIRTTKNEGILQSDMTVGKQAHPIKRFGTPYLLLEISTVAQADLLIQLDLLSFSSPLELSVPHNPPEQICNGRLQEGEEEAPLHEWKSVLQTQLDVALWHKLLWTTLNSTTQL